MRLLRSATLGMADGQGGAARPPVRWRAWAWRIFGGLGGLLVVTVLAVVVVLRSLDRPWLKGRIQRIARDAAGLDVDYRAARIDPFSGAELDGVVVRSPAEVRRVAPELLRVDTVTARWSLGTLLFGHGPSVDRIAISGATVTVAMDENGRTTFDSFPPSPPNPKTPTSQLLARALGSPLPVRQVEVDPLTLALVESVHGEPVERFELRGVALALEQTSAEPAAHGWRVQAGIGSPAHPVELELAHTRDGAPAGSARAKLGLSLDANPASLTAAMDLRMIEQTFASRVSADHWLHAEVEARFEPAASRTEVHLDRLEAGDGAATATADVELPDTGDPIVEQARADVDVARLLRWLPPELVPASAERAHLKAQVDSLVAGSPPRLADGGSVNADVDLANVTARAPGTSLRVGDAALSVHAQPAEHGGLAARGSLATHGVVATTGEDRVDADDVAIDFDATRSSDGAVTGHAGLRIARLERGGAAPLAVRDAKIDLRAEDVHLDTASPIATRGDVTLSADVASIDARAGGYREIAEGASIRVHAGLLGHPPYAVEITAPVARLRLVDRAGRSRVDAPVRVDVQAHDVRPDADRPARSEGAAKAAIDVGDAHVTLDATKAPEALDYDLRVAARTLGLARPWLPESLRTAAPWERMSLTLRSTGRVDRLEHDPSVKAATDVELGQPSFSGVAAQAITLNVRSQGTAMQHQGDLELQARGLTVDALAPGDDHVTLTATVDRAAPSLRFQLAADGRAEAKASASVSFDRARKALVYESEAHFAKLGALAALAAKVPGLDAFDLSELVVDLSARGDLLGVLTGVNADGAMTFAPKPATTAALEGTTDLKVGHFKWAKGDDAVLAPSASWHAEMRSEGAKRVLESHLDAGSVHLDLGVHDVDLHGIADESTVEVTGDLLDPAIALTHRLSVKGITQTMAPQYPTGDVDFSVQAERGPEGVIHISDLKLVNGLGGTSLAMSGNVFLGEGRRTLSVTTSLTQDLARLSTVPERFRGQGKASVEAAVTSPNFTQYRVRASVKGEGVSLVLPRAGYAIETANGEVPITMSLEAGKDGVSLARSEKRSPYSMLRFTDQHPLLTRSGFLSIASVKTPFVSIAPLVGNLEIDQNLISLRQFEMGVRGGTITGQCGLDWEGPKSNLELHVRASGVQSSHGEPFDGNIAVVISAADRTVDGRAEILRIGERHLLDLLDMEDPLHQDPAMNRVRGALAIGYPDTVRLAFDHGFASAHIELGGLGRLVSISDLRGIPMGSLVDKMLAPVLESTAPKRTP